jgi:hypothetical protein
LVGTERERTRGFAGSGFLADGGAAWEAVAGAAHTRRVQDALNRQVRYAGGSLHGEAYPRIYVVGTATSLGMRARHADVDGPTGKTAARSGRRVRELHVAGGASQGVWRTEWGSRAHIGIRVQRCTACTARRGVLERGGTFQPRGLFRVAMFNCDFLPILQLKCTE